MTTSNVGIDASRVAARRSGIKRPRRGVAAVEFAIVAPLFFLLLAGIIEFGQAFRIQHMLSTASRQGARLAIVDSATTIQVQQKVQSLCVKTLGVSEGDVTVDIAVNGNIATDLSQAEQGDEIQVAVKIPFSKAGIGFYAQMFSDAVLSSNCIFERE